MESEFVEFLECAGYSEKQTKESIKHYFKNQNSFESKLDKHGYMKLQLLTAFEYFGSAMCVGSSSLHANEFYLETERLENC